MKKRRTKKNNISTAWIDNNKTTFDGITYEWIQKALHMFLIFSVIIQFLKYNIDKVAY